MTGECPFCDSSGWPALVLHSRQGSGAQMKAGPPLKREGLLGRPWAPCHPDLFPKPGSRSFPRKGCNRRSLYPQTRDQRPGHPILVSIPLEPGNAGPWPALSPALDCGSEALGPAKEERSLQRVPLAALGLSTLEEGWVAERMPGNGLLSLPWPTCAG